jgi:hypothetical protein
MCGPGRPAHGHCLSFGDYLLERGLYVREGSSELGHIALYAFWARQDAGGSGPISVVPDFLFTPGAG